jgi:hypothetical protein
MGDADAAWRDRNRGEAIAPVPAPRVIGVSPKLKPASITV